MVSLLDYYMDQPTVNQNIAQYSSWATLNLVSGNAANIGRMRTLDMKAKLQSKILDNDRVTDSTAKEGARDAVGRL